jgi:GMP synthase-like glutamine amidotransferase
MPVTLTDEARADPVFAGLPTDLLSLQWHGDTFDLPDGAVRLASSEAYPNQAFRFGASAYGVQFHLEVSAAMAREWAAVPEYEAYADRVLGQGSLPELIGEMEEQADTIRQSGRLLFERWLDTCVAQT